MKILRKRVGSIIIEDYSKIKIVNDSIFLDDKIIFNFLPIKNLVFFNLNLVKSNFDSKYWVFLDLNLSNLFNELQNGKIVTSRDLIFDMINSSLNRLKISNYKNKSIKINNTTISDLIKNKNFKIDNFFCFDEQFVKYDKVFFDIKRMLITIDKCKKKRIKIPLIIILNNFEQLKKTVISLMETVKFNNKNSLFIISKKDREILNSKLFNPFYKENIENIIYSEDLNFQMENYLNQIGNNEFLNQLEFESSNFFYNKANLFILAKNLTDISINYLSYCNFEKLLFMKYSDIEQTILKLIENFNKFRISKSDNFNNYLISNYIISERIFEIKLDDEQLKYDEIKIDNFPWIDWKKSTDIHFLSLDKSNRQISNFVKIGINNDWSESYIENLKNIVKPDMNKCPISLTELDSFSVITECSHSFNLNNLIKWMDDNNECPICRQILSFKTMRFLNSPNFNIFFKSLSLESKFLLICDSLWFDKFKEENFFNKKKVNYKIVEQKSFANGNMTKEKNPIKIINLSCLSNSDINYINSHFNYIKDLEFVRFQ